MEQAFQERDAGFDGLFVAAVKTTGIYCRPSCPARRPLRENCEYFATVQEAVGAGYRACKRCDPESANGRAPEWVARLISQVDAGGNGRLTGTELATLGVDASRVRRWFQRHHGMTFTAFCRARRLGKSLESLGRGQSLDEVALGHGYESHSGFREAFGRHFGSAPGRARGGACITTSILESPVGPLLVGAVEAGVCLLEFSDPERAANQVQTTERLLGMASVPGAHPWLTRLQEELTRYFEGALQSFTVPLVAPGTPFQESVWNALRTIPYGQTCSYETLAARAGHPGACRAVGTANGRNRLAILIPCHRVVNKGGALGGYGGGLWRKRILLELELGRNSSGHPPEV